MPRRAETMSVSGSSHLLRIVCVVAGHADELPSDKGQDAGGEAGNAVNEQLRYVVIHSAPLSVSCERSQRLGDKSIVGVDSQQ
jgi:hypothetical protein